MPRIYTVENYAPPRDVASYFDENCTRAGWRVYVRAAAKDQAALYLSQAFQNPNRPPLRSISLARGRDVDILAEAGAFDRPGTVIVTDYDAKDVVVMLPV